MSSAPRILSTKTIGGAGQVSFEAHEPLLAGECSSGVLHSLALTFANGTNNPINVPYATLLSILRYYFAGVIMEVGAPVKDEWLHNYIWDFLREAQIDALAQDWMVNGVSLQSIANLSIPGTTGGTFLFEGISSFDHRRLADKGMYRPGASILKNFIVRVNTAGSYTALPANVTLTAANLTVFVIPAYGPDRMCAPPQSMRYTDTERKVQIEGAGALLMLAERSYPLATTPIGRVSLRSKDGPNLVEDAQVAFNAPGGFAARNLIENYNDPVKLETTGGSGASAAGITPIYRVSQRTSMEALASTMKDYEFEQLDYGSASVAQPDLHAIVVPALGAGAMAAQAKNLGNVLGEAVGVRASAPSAQVVRSSARQVTVLPLDLVAPDSPAAAAQPGVHFVAGQRPQVFLPSHIAAYARQSLAQGNTKALQQMGAAIPGHSGSGWFENIVDKLKSSMQSAKRR